MESYTRGCRAKAAHVLFKPGAARGHPGQRRPGPLSRGREQHGAEGAVDWQSRGHLLQLAPFPGLRE